MNTRPLPRVERDMRALLLPVLLALAAGCAATHQAARAEAADKLTAPVTVSAAVKPGHATVTITFLAAATRVTATVQGLDGLTVGDPGSLPKAEYGARETAVLEVPLTSAAGTLAVYVNGVFGSSPYSRAMTFAVGPSAGPSDAGVVQTDQGPVKALPAGK